jgi:deoxyribose-phosphate aldolase
MNLEENYLTTFYELQSILKTYSPINKKLIGLIDLTLLDENASDQALALLAGKASQFQVAAVCILPQQVEKIKRCAEVKLATVVNFPEGNQTTSQVLAAIDTLLTNTTINEIDYVFPYSSYLEGEQHFALEQCQKAYQLCQQKKVLLKVILETGALPSLDSIYQLSREIIDKGCDFLKTSTGKIAQGATLSAAFSILQAIKEAKVSCGLKVSGGIKKPDQAFNYMLLAQHVLDKAVDRSWFRIGASSLLEELNT